MMNFKRLHPGAIFVSLLFTLKGMLIPLVAAFFIGGASNNRLINPLLLFSLILFAVFLYGLVKWYTFRYRLTDGELEIKQGVLVKRNRYIRRERVAAINIVSGFVQRMFGLVKVTIETAGGKGEPELELIAVKNEDALALRSALLNQQVDECNQPHLDKAWHLSNKRLLISAITSSGIGIVLSAFLAMLTQLEGLLTDELYQNAMGFAASLEHLSFLIGMFVILAIAWIISIIITIIKYSKFHIRLENEKLLVQRGLLDQHQLTLDLQKITAIRVVSNLLRQPFGYVTVYVESSGGSVNDEGMSTILVPLMKKKELVAFFQEMLPVFSYESKILPIPKKAWWRYQVRMLALPFIISIIAFFWLTSFGVYVFFALPFFSLLAYMQYKDAGYGVNGQLIWMAYRKISKVHVMIPKKRVQSIGYVQSFLQKRSGFARLDVMVLSSADAKTFSVREMSEPDCDGLFNWYKEK